MSLGNVIGSMKGPHLLNEDAVYRTLIEGGLAFEEDVFPVLPLVPGNKSTYLHVSGLGFFCTRAETLRIVHRLVVRRIEDPQSAYTFAVGNAHHEAFQGRILPMLVGERLRGWWEYGAEIVRGDSVPIDGFERASLYSGMPEWTYVEPSFRSHVFGVSGRVDGVIDWTGSDLPWVPDGLEIQELKSHAMERWSGIDPMQGGTALPWHVLQCKVYLWLSGLKHARIVYIKKGISVLKDCFVEWRVSPFTDEERVAFETRIKDHWQAVLDAHKSKTVSPSKECTSASCSRAKNCPVRHECFHTTPKAPRPFIRKMTEDEEVAWTAKIVM